MSTALAAAVLPASAQASRSGVNAGHPVHPGPSLPGAAQAAAARNTAGVITGVVDGAGGRPLTGVCVIAAGANGSSMALTRSDGRYILGGLHPGGYTLHYSACAASGYADQWSGGASWPGSAAKVTIAQGESRALAPVTLRTVAPVTSTVIPWAVSRLRSSAGTFSGLARPRPGSQAGPAGGAASSAKTGAIAGRVTGGGKPQGSICVNAEGPNFSRTLTSKAGQYRIPRLRPGRYIVFFVADSFCGKNPGNWLPQYYKNVNGPVIRKQPTQVTVTAGQTVTGIDAALRLGGEISGTVRGQDGKTVARVCVIAEGRAKRTFLQGFTISGKDGGYALHSLFPGKYKVVFLPGDCDNSKGNYLPQWWPGSSTQKHAQTIVVSRGLIVRRVDSALRPGAILSGVVRAGNSRGALLKRICVEAEPVRSQGEFDTYGFTSTGKDGSYRITGLETGKYSVFFSRFCGNNGNFLPVHRSVSVVAGHVTSGFDAFLPPGAIITGTVTDTHGAPVRGICVEASGPGFGGVVTKRDGTYSIIALPTGHYSLNFSGGCDNDGSYASQYYRGQDNVASATPVAITAGHTTPGIDAAMQPGGTITGVVTDSKGNRVANACVELENPALAQFGYPYYIESTGKHGGYTVRNLDPGLYVVGFGCFYGSGKFARQWFMGQPGSGTANYVSAPAGVIASGIDATVQPGGFITGEVTNHAGKPLSGICVQVTPQSSPLSVLNGFFGRLFGFTNSHGVYRIGPLAATKYDVQFGCFPGRYGSQWYRGTSARASATPVPVANNATTTGINAALTTTGSISGEVTTGANQPQNHVCVEASDAADDLSGFAETNAHGQYTMHNLSAGSYEITFSDCGFGKHHVRLGRATRTGLVTVTGPQAVTGVNGKLFPAGSMSGIVRGGPAATLQANACVVVVPTSPNSAVHSIQTSSNGGYRLADLAPGTYQVYFGDPFCFFAGANYAPQWFDNQASQATAGTVTVTSSHATTGIDATLGADGVITGTVTSHGHTPVAGECVTASPVTPVADPLFGSVLHPVIGVTAADGTYSLVDLLPGKYTVQFSIGCGDTGFRTQWWRHARSAADATVITVSANGTIAGIDAILRHHAGG